MWQFLFVIQKLTRQLFSKCICHTKIAQFCSFTRANRAKSILQERFGNKSEIVKSYVKKIMGLPYNQNANPKKIGEFSVRLNHCVQALQTMDKINQVDGYVAVTLEKLPDIPGDLVKMDHDWERWNFAQLSEAVRLRTRWNPADPNCEKSPTERSTKSFHPTNRMCVCCGEEIAMQLTVTRIVNVAERKQILKKKRLCFNWAIGSHRAAECLSKSTCQHCRRRHHSSICNSLKREEKKEIALTTNHSPEGVFPVPKGEACDDSTKQVEMLMSSNRVCMESYHLST